MGRKTFIGLLFPLLFFFLISLIFYFPVLKGSVPLNGNLIVGFFSPWKYQIPLKFMGVDEIREFYPLLDFTYDALQTGTIPLWNPYNFSGYPHLANWASAVFYPLHIVAFFLSKINLLIFLKLSAIILSGLFTYLYLRCLSLNKFAAFFGGMAFASSAPMLIWGAEIWQSVHSFFWLPLILFALEKIIRVKKILYLALFALGLTASIMGGYIQPTIYIFITVFIYTLLRWKAFTKKTFLLVIMAIILGLGLSAIQIIPATEAFLLSPRREISLLELNLDFLLSPLQILTFFIPDIFGHIATQNWFLQRPGQYYENMIYIGVVPLIFSSFALFNAKLRLYVIFFLAVGVLTLSSIFDLPTSRLAYQLHVPFLSTAIPIRIILLTAFSLSVLSALGIEAWLGSRIKASKAFFSLAPLAVIYLAIIIWIAWSFLYKSSLPTFPPNWYTISLRNLLLPLSVFLITTVIILTTIKFPRFKKPAFFVLLVILISHSWIFFQKYAAFTETKLIYPQHPLLSYLREHQGLYRYWGYGEANLTNNFATVYKIYSPEGYDPVNIKFYNQLLSAVNTGSLLGIASRSDAVIPAGSIYPPQDSNSLRLKLLDLLGVKFVGYYGEKFKENPNSKRFSIAWEDNNFMIFENKKAYERAFLVPQALYAQSDEEAIRIIYLQETDLSKEVILQEKVDIENNGLNPQGEVNIEEYKPNTVTIKASTNVSQFLVLSDAYYPGWQATVNGHLVKIYKADYSLRAVILPAGESEIVFTYRPKSFTYGSLISGASLLLVLSIILFSIIKNKTNKKR